METQLYFWRPLIEMQKKQLSSIIEYYKRTVVAFKDVEEEAEKYADTFYKKFPASEDDDPATIAEQAYDKSLEKYETLCIMKLNHLLMTIAMLYQVWEQQLIKFTMIEMSNYLSFEKALDYKEVQIIFKLHGVDIIKTCSWNKIRELKFLVNTVKHGEGISADKLRKIRPDFFELDEIEGADTLKFHKAVLLDSYSLQVKEDDLYAYFEATKSFWDEMPERAYSDTNTITTALNEAGE